jgi:predicted class III extradiol MEMO1 family dioxygenase
MILTLKTPFSSARKEKKDEEALRALKKMQSRRWRQKKKKQRIHAHGRGPLSYSSSSSSPFFVRALSSFSYLSLSLARQ